MTVVKQMSLGLGSQIAKQTAGLQVILLAVRVSSKKQSICCQKWSQFQWIRSIPLKPLQESIQDSLVTCEKRGSSKFKYCVQVHCFLLLFKFSKEFLSLFDVDRAAIVILHESFC